MSQGTWKETVAETMMQETYILNGIRYLPHYQNPGRFVAPGYDKYSTTHYGAHELVSAGAAVEMYPLWSRARAK